MQAHGWLICLKLVGFASKYHYLRKLYCDEIRMRLRSLRSCRSRASAGRPVDEELAQAVDVALDFLGPLFLLPIFHYALGPAATWDQPALREALRPLLDPATDTNEFDGLRLEVQLPGRGRQPLRLYGRRLRYNGEPTGRVLLGVEGVGE